MLISCHNCATSYQVEPSSLGPTGRSVRCARCQKVWFASNPMALAEIAQGYRADVGAPPPVEREIVSGVASPEDSFAVRDDAVDWDAPPLDEAGAAQSLASGAAADEIPGPPPAALAKVEAPALAPVDPGEPPAPPRALRASEDIETVALRLAKKESAGRLRWPLAAWPTAILALVVINGALIVRRADVVRWVPQTASLYSAIGLPVNLRGLDLADVTTKKEIRDGVQMLVVEGSIVSLSSRAAAVPRLRFGVRNEAGREIYSWTALPDRKVLPAGETMTFRSLLATPPREGREVVVRFFTRRDLVADIQ
jgi:predicted Zn finger-like uncharacterized protein